MKIKKVRNKLLCGLILMLSFVVLSACNNNDDEEKETMPKNPIGIYTNVMDFEDISSRLVGTQAMKADKDSVGQLSAVTVYKTSKGIQLDDNNKPVKDGNGEIIHVANDNKDQTFYKYIFTKNAIIAGEDFLVYNRGQYTGYCTYDEKTGQLLMYTPEYYMAYTTRNKELDDWPETVENIKVTDEVLANLTSGLSFSSEFQSHGGNTLADSLSVNLKSDKNFDFISTYSAEDSSKGNNYDYQFKDFGYLYNSDETGEE